MTKSLKLLLFFVIFFIITIPIAIFLLSKNKPKIPVKNIAPIQKAVDLCTPFSADKGEISCEEAKTIALKKIPGSVSEIDKKNMDLINPKGISKTYKLWLVTITSNRLIKNHNEFIIGIDVIDGKIKYSGLK